MKRGLIGVALALALGVGGAQAQDRMTQPLCDAGPGAVFGLVGQDVPEIIGQPRVDEAGWCVLEAVQVFEGSFNAVIDRLRWRGADMARLVDAGLPPRSLDLEMVGLRQQPKVDYDPLYSYLIGVQLHRNAIDATLTVRWDGVQKALILDRLAIDFPGENRVEASARLDGIDLTDTGTMQMSIGTVALSDLDLLVESNGLFEDFLLFPLGFTLLEHGDTPPEVQVRWWIGQAQRLVAGLSDELLPPRSKAALSALLDEMPMPSGIPRLTLDTAEPLGVMRVLLAAGDEPDPAVLIDTVLAGATLIADWQPTPERAR